MIRFIDLTEEYWIDPECGFPLCAFLCTSSDTFIKTLDDIHVFTDQDEIDEHSQAARLRSLMPNNFFKGV